MTIVPTGITRAVFRGGLHIQKHAPTLMFGAGIIGVVGSTVLACKATLELSNELDKMKDEQMYVRHARDEGELDDKAVAFVYAKNLAHVAKLYAPAAIVGLAGIGALTGSHVTLNRRNAGLTAAYAAIDKAYDEYRARVRDELGDDKESDLYRGIETSAKGKGGKSEELVIPMENGASPYARCFDECSTQWVRNAEYNRHWVRCQEAQANDQLHSRGHLFLNEVYRGLGLEDTPAGAVTGWIMGAGGDDFVDFGLHDPRNERFMAGHEQSAWLDFNVDGVIFDKI